MTGRSKEFKTPNATLAFARDLFKPRTQDESKAPRYGCTLIFPKSATKAPFEAAIKEALEQEWPGAWQDMLKGGLIKTPFLSGDGKEARHKETGKLHPGMGPDVWFIRVQATEDRPPAIRWKSPTIPATRQEVYSGCQVFAVLSAFTWDNKQNGKGVSFGVVYVQKVGEGTPLSEGDGPVDPTKYFEKIADEGVAPEAQGDNGAGGLFG